MFESARIKLTLLYLIILMTVSGIFSLVIYRFVTLEIERGFVRVEQRLRQNRPELLPPRGQYLLFMDEYEDAKREVAVRLLYLNGVIAIVAASGAYYLASKTLKPIEEAYEEQKRFIADASHELKTPITAIKTNIEVTLRDKRLNLKSAKGVLKESLQDITGLQSLTLTLLSLTRYQGSEAKLIFEPVDLQDILHKSVKKLSTFAKEKKISMKEEVSPVVFCGDSESVSKLVTILVDNALKYTDKGGKVTVSAGKVKRLVEIKVKDNGMGISSEDLPHIFDRFYRADQSRCKQKIPGYGLGLSMAKKIVDLHDGSIDVISEIDKGATFIIKLPESS